MSAFDHVDTILPQPVWDGIVARPVHGERLTVAVVAEHSHDHEQIGIVLRGSIRFRVGDEERELGPGGTWRIASQTPHDATAGPDGATVIGVFAPTRDDWAAIEQQEPRPERWP